MAYEQAPFGDGSTSGNGNVTTTVNNHYGERESGKTIGVMNVGGVMNELILDIDGTIVGDGAFALLAPTLPAGCRIEDIFFNVTEAFVLGGSTPVIDVGTEGSEATNGFTVTEAQAEAVGMYDLTGALSGTWSTAVGLVADTVVGILLGGSTPTVTTAGKAKVIIRYVNA